MEVLDIIVKKDKGYLYVYLWICFKLIFFKDASFEDGGGLLAVTMI